MRRRSPEEFRDFLIGQFEELLRQSAKQPLVYGIALHTVIVGQPYRLRLLCEALQYIVRLRSARKGRRHVQRMTDQTSVSNVVLPDVAHPLEAVCY